VISTKAANSVFTLYVGSLLISFLVGTFYFKEKINLQKILGMVFVILGLISLVYPFDIKLMSIGVIWGLLSGIMEGTTNVM
jgi:drug/metabolite transporter (DMT)-like permease